MVNVAFAEYYPGKQLSNLALSSFSIGQNKFASFEGFWQGVKFELDDPWREATFVLHGYDARNSGRRARTGGYFTENGKFIQLKDKERFKLAALGLLSKFTQDEFSKECLLETEDEEITHVLVDKRTNKPFRDSVTLPSVQFCKQLMRIRQMLNTGNRGLAYLLSKQKDLSKAYWL
jgi:predicted NAD-dependent protein-ADP-ribosyltransferase YbiA (DUF1768 family)